jgi:hypothetical protein
MKITVSDLIRNLEQYDEDAEVRVAFQPGWPLRATVCNVISSEEIAEAKRYQNGEEDEPREGGDSESFVWIAVDQVGGGWGENPYAPKLAWSGS